MLLLAFVGLICFTDDGICQDSATFLGFRIFLRFPPFLLLAGLVMFRAAESRRKGAWWVVSSNNPNPILILISPTHNQEKKSLRPEPGWRVCGIDCKNPRSADMEVGDVASLMPWSVWMDLTGRSMIRVAEGTGSTKDDVLWPAEMEVHPRLYGSKDNNGEQPRGRPVSYTHLTLPTKGHGCRSRWSPYH